MSTSFLESISSSMRWEFTEVGIQSIIFSVGLATFDYIAKVKTSFFGGIIDKFMLNWVLFFVAIFKTCSMYNPPKKGKDRGPDAIIHDYPLAQMLVNILYLGVMNWVSDWIFEIDAKLTEEERTAYGKLMSCTVSFCAHLNLLITFRAGFLLVDWFCRGYLSRGMRSLVCKEVEGLPIGKTNIHGD